MIDPCERLALLTLETACSSIRSIRALAVVDQSRDLNQHSTNSQSQRSFVCCLFLINLVIILVNYINTMMMILYSAIRSRLQQRCWLDD